MANRGLSFQAGRKFSGDRFVRSENLLSKVTKRVEATVCAGGCRQIKAEQLRLVDRQCSAIIGVAPAKHA